MIDLVPLVNKTVAFKFRGAELKLDLSHALFSSFEVDVGTRLLLKAVGRDPVLAASRRILDVGSGVGVIGIAMAKAFPDARVEARDRDFLACAFTERNRVRNKAANLVVVPGLIAAGALTSHPTNHGLAAGGPAASTDGPYDFILSNLPAKAGGPVLEAFFRQAPALLSPLGRLAVVIVKPLVEAALRWIEAAGLNIVGTERGSGHMAWVLEPRDGAARQNAVAMQGAEAARDAALPPAAEPSASGNLVAAIGPGREATFREDGSRGDEPFLYLVSLDLGLYHRRHGRFKLGQASFEANGFWGLPDFDTVGYASRLAVELAERSLPGSLVRDALVINPGIGHFPLWLSRKLGPDRIIAASRDLLGLAATGENIAGLPGRKPSYRALDALRLDALAPASIDLLVDFADKVPEYEWTAPFWEQALRLLKRGGTLIFTGSPTELQRLEKHRPSGFRLIAGKRKKGFAAAAWRME